MKIQEYQNRALDTVNRKLGETDLEDMALMGLISEWGEIFNLLKKVYYHVDDPSQSGVLTPSQLDQLESEIGDVLWYTNLLVYCIYKREGRQAHKIVLCKKLKEAIIHIGDYVLRIDLFMPSYFGEYDFSPMSVMAKVTEAILDASSELGSAATVSYENMRVEYVSVLVNEIVNLARYFNISLETAMRRNIDKLQVRHGKSFDPTAHNER